MNNNPETVFVRTATPDDRLILQRHKQQSLDESQQYRGFIPATPSSEIEISFVAGVGNTVFGSLTLVRVATAEWAVAHVFVEPEAREIGIGDALMLSALSSLKRDGATWISAQAQPGDRALKNLFERHGLVAQTITVGRRLSDPSTEADASQ